MRRKNTIDIKQLVKGNKAAWDAFVDRYSPLIYSAIRRVLLAHLKKVNPYDISEVFQEVFLRLIKDEYRLLKKYNYRKASLATWLVIITRSTALDFLRKRPPSHEPLNHLKPPIEKPKSPVHSSLYLPSHILSGRQQLVLTLLFEKGLTPQEAAPILGVNEQTIRSTKHKAIKKLRKFFAKKTSFRR